MNRIEYDIAREEAEMEHAAKMEQKFEFNEQLFPEHDCGHMVHRCKHCKARMWLGERLAKSKKGDPEFSLCCRNGKVSLKVPKMPRKLVEYLTKNTAEARYFREHIRQINAAFAFTSFGCKQQIRYEGMPGSFKVQGQIYHNIGKHFGPSAAEKKDKDAYKPKFASIYFYDTDNELDNRMKFTKRC